MLLFGDGGLMRGVAGFSEAKRLDIITRLLRIPRGPTRPYVAIWQIGSQLQIARYVHGPREYLPWHSAERMLMKLERARISPKGAAPCATGLRGTAA